MPALVAMNKYIKGIDLGTDNSLPTKKLYKIKIRKT